MGPVNLSFVGDQIKTVLAMGHANTRNAHEDDRADWYGQVWDRVRSSPTNVVVGEGFGQALINFEDEDGNPVRQPHNSSLTVLARLGFVGLSIWLLFIGLVLARFVGFLRMRSASEGVTSTILWLFLCFLYLFSKSPACSLSWNFRTAQSRFISCWAWASGSVRIRKNSFDAGSISARALRT